eukprot:7257628-Lingulodinium_polyedra.AAC.1
MPSAPRGSQCTAAQEFGAGCDSGSQGQALVEDLSESDLQGRQVLAPSEPVDSGERVHVSDGNTVTITKNLLEDVLGCLQ